ncbi:MAG: NAD-dependent DNA ligase LigA [Oligoflexia bacterium]|nr:NAD-dependent DNA ligase LigA [Oligoflexia bacterium]
MNKDAFRLKELVSLINKYNVQYYENNESEVSDHAYDLLFRELEELEKKYPELVDENTPTKKVGLKASDGFKKKEHKLPMLSISNSMDHSEMVQFHERVLKNLGIKEEKKLYICEPKFDGLSMNLTYENGKLLSAVTRGDGRIGEDVTSNAKVVKNIPQKLTGKNLPKVFEVRGEILLPISAFQKLNREQEKEGKKVFANPRNAASGSMRQLDWTITQERDLKFMAYSIGFWSDGHKPETQHEVLKFLESEKFHITEYFALCSNPDEIESFYLSISEKRESLDFDIDGVVVKVNRFDYLEELGAVSRSLRGMTAYKFAPRQEKTKIESISLQVGRTGVITPVANLYPVNIHGVTVSRAALHNQEEIERKDIRIGDTVVVQRAGDVIPEIVSVDLSFRTGKEKKFVFPKKCPSCGSDLIKLQDEVAIRCLNSLSCPAQIQEQIEHFISKSGFNIVGLGTKIIEQLLENKLISSAKDIFTLKEADLLNLEGFKEKSAKKLVEAIEESKKIELPKFLFALGIRHVGERMARTLASNYPDIRSLFKLSVEDFLKLEDVGETVAMSIHNFFQDKKNQEEIQSLIDLGIQISAKEKVSDALLGKTFVITGSFEQASREEISSWIQERSGKVSSSISKKTDFLIAGENAGSKLEKARTLGVKIISYDELSDLSR